MESLGWWLMLVGSLRLASVWFGFFNIPRLRSGVYGRTPVTAVHGRTFALWTLVTCTLCYTCAFNLDNKPLYLVTLLSFVYALVHFLLETLVYKSMSFANLTTVSFFADIFLLVLLLVQRLCSCLIRATRHINCMDAGEMELASRELASLQPFLKGS
ncbi:Ergosterol biosynthetic protein 28 [Linum perenne]